jgi:hypothetical protein
MSLTKISLVVKNLFISGHGNLVRDTLPGDGNIENLFLQCRYVFVEYLNVDGMRVVHGRNAAVLSCIVFLNQRKV